MAKNRKPRKSDFVGKTIKSVNISACNIWTFYFTDGSAIAIEAEVFHPGFAAMEVCRACVQPEKGCAA